ncbi:hypothetical protein FQN49_002376 [Arthroderma sp. PD_2]|nr:hypothetical protein FQN49_002376 [Arthroderma sp. PD_2]
MPMQHSLDMELITAAARYADENRSRRNIHNNPEGVIGHERTDSSLYGNSATPPTDGAAEGTDAATADPASSGAEGVADNVADDTADNVNEQPTANDAKTPAGYAI